ncbi:MAG: hypothetical protein R3A44_13465 [Caldilineaceae bacterium]
MQHIEVLFGLGFGLRKLLLQRLNYGCAVRQFFFNNPLSGCFRGRLPFFSGGCFGGGAIYIVSLLCGLVGSFRFLTIGGNLVIDKFAVMASSATSSMCSTFSDIVINPQYMTCQYFIPLERFKNHQ